MNIQYITMVYDEFDGEGGADKRKKTEKKTTTMVYDGIQKEAIRPIQICLF